VAAEFTARHEAITASLSRIGFRTRLQTDRAGFAIARVTGRCRAVFSAIPFAAGTNLCNGVRAWVVEAPPTPLA
jgi:hypothetical protein